MAEARYFVQTFGCRVNQADSAGIAAELDALHLTRSRSHLDADVVVLNTCTVTHRSDADVRKAVHRLERENPGAKVIVTGCYAQREPEALVQLGGVSAVVGNAEKHRLPEVVDALLGRACGEPLAHPRTTPVVVLHSAIEDVDPRELPPVEPVTTVLDRTRPFVKIQDGCDAACTYCIIPAVRGRARSAEPERVVRAVRSLVEQGYQEIVLAGVHLGTYGAALPEPEDLTALVRRVLAVPGLVRLRMSCIEPMAFPLALADLAAEDPRLLPHFHLPLQAGCDRTLKRMVRPYRAADYAAMLAELRRRLPEVCLGTDVIVGFPGETDAEFEESVAFVESVGLDYVHVFSYSDREGTPATRLGPKVEPRVIKERSARLHATGSALWGRFLDRQLGRTLTAVTLERSEDEPRVIEALAGNYAPIRLDAPDLEPNRLVEVRVEARRGAKLTGRVEAVLGA